MPVACRGGNPRGQKRDIHLTLHVGAPMVTTMPSLCLSELLSPAVREKFYSWFLMHVDIHSPLLHRNPSCSLLKESLCTLKIFERLLMGPVTTRTT